MKRNYLWCCFGILLALSVMSPITDSDVFFGLSLGRLFFHGGIPSQDPYLYTVKNWNVWHQWLSSVLYYIFYSAAQIQGLMLLRLLQWFGIFALILHRARQWKVSESVVAVLLFLAAVVCSQRFFDRASVFSDLLLVGITAYLLGRESLSRRALWVFPLIFALWVNLHAGFVLGLAVFTLFVLSKGARASVALWLSLMFSYLACLFNPRLLEGALYPVRTAFKPEWELYRKLHLEWEPSFREPFLHSAEARILIGLLLLSALLLVFVARKNWKKSLFPVFCFGLFLYLGQDASRFMSTSALGCVILCLFLIHEIHWKISPQWDEKFKALIAAGFVGLSFWIWHNGYTLFYGHQDVKVGLSEGNFPVQATDFIEKNKLQGRIFNQYEWGSYLIWRLNQPDSLFIHTYVDEPQFLVNDYYGMNRARTFFDSTVARYDIRYFLLDSKILGIQPRPHLLSFLDNWRVIYQDDTAILWVRLEAKP